MNCTIGNNCAIMTSVKLKDESIPDNTSVYLSEGQWRCKPVDLSLHVSENDALNLALIVSVDVFS